jgi:NitT/TauT family transport system substrate-binding protein
MRHYRSRIGALIGLVLAASLAAGCGSDSGSDGGGNSDLEKPKIKVAMLSLVNNAPYYIAVKNKLFEKEGLTVETRPVQQSTLAYPALQKGEIDLVFANDASLFVGHDQNKMKINLIAEGTTVVPKNMGVLVMPNSPIKTMKDLEGKSLAVHVLNNIQAITFNQILKANNIDPGKVKYRQIIFPQMATALQKGDVDAIHTVEPFLSDAQKKLGARLVADGGAEPVTDLPLDGYFALEEWAKKNPKTAAAFQRAMQKAQQLAADRKQVEAVLPSYAKGVDPATAAIMTMPGYPTSNNAARVQRLIDIMKEQGQLKTAMDAKTIVFGAS